MRAPELGRSGGSDIGAVPAPGAAIDELADRSQHDCDDDRRPRQTNPEEEPDRRSRKQESVCPQKGAHGDGIQSSMLSLPIAAKVVNRQLRALKPSDEFSCRS